MTTVRRNLLWPLVLVAVGLVWLLIVLGQLPEAVGDLLQRSWPALLVLLGFDLLFGRYHISIARRKVPLAFFEVILTLVLVFGVIWQAYAQQADTIRSDSRTTFEELIDPAVTRVQLEINLKRTAVTVVALSDGANRLAAEYNGSEASDVAMTWNTQDESGTLSITETYRSAIPKLEEYGKGTLSVTLPANVVTELLQINVTEGAVDLQTQPGLIQRFEINTGEGDITLATPHRDAVTGVLQTGEGDIFISVSEDVPLRVRLAQGSSMPNYIYDEMRYYLLAGGTLERRNAEFIQAEFAVDVEGGSTVTVEDLPAPD